MVSIVDINVLIELKSEEGLLSPCEIAQKDITKWNPTRLFGWRMAKLEDQIIQAKKYYRDQIVVDIGCGVDIGMFRACCMAGARGYIGVDCNYDYDAKLMANLLLEEYWQEMDAELKIQEHRRDVPCGIAYERAQDFLSRLPDASVSLYAGGIDFCMIPSNEEVAEIEREIVRVLDPNGAYMANCSRLFHSFQDHVPKESMKRVVHYERYPEFEVRVKRDAN